MKMSMICGVLIAGSIVIASIGLAKLEAINDAMDRVTEKYVPRTLSAVQIRDTLRQLIILEKNFILEDDPRQMEALAREIQAKTDVFHEELKGAHVVASADMDAHLRETAAIFDEWTALNERIKALGLDGKDDQASALSRGAGHQLRVRLDRVVDEMIVLNQNRMQEEAKLVDAEALAARHLMMVIGVLATLLGSGFATVLLRAIARTMDRVIGQLRVNSATVSSAAQQIASSSQELSSASTEQASCLQQTSSAVEEVSATIRRNADDATRSMELSRVSIASVTRGKEVVGSMMRAIGDIEAANERIVDQIGESNRRMGEMVQVIGEIAAKTNVINDIVFQTKLLSFNASVEAARAGDHGKGFAVVAEEVGSLAAMSGNAAKEIGSMLESSMRRVESIAAETKTAVDRLVVAGRGSVETGKSVAGECGRVLDEIVANSEGVSRMVSDIAGATGEQTRGVDEITRAITSIDAATQQNAAVSEEAARAAEELAAQATALEAVVRELIVTVKGDGARANEPVALAPSPRVTAAAAPTEKRAAKSNVVALSPRKAARSTPPAAARIAVGSDVVPSAEDARFEDV
jgi:methyl-accepting chemotaxis protein